MIQFVDSTDVPTVAQVQAAIAQGYTAWAFYLVGPGHDNNWTPADVDVLRQGGMSLGLPIYVPLLDLSSDPTTDAQDFAAAIKAVADGAVGVLDTEASMRGNPNLVPYADGFTAELGNQGVSPIVYGGGNYVPTGVPPWWIQPDAATVPYGQALQVGSGSVAGVSVDLDLAGTGFPFASLTPGPTPVVPNTIPQEVIMGLPTGCTDQGAVRCQIREWWDTYRDDPMSVADQQFWLDLFYRPADQPMLGILGMAGDPDLLLAGIVDNANGQGHLRPAFVNSV